MFAHSECTAQPSETMSEHPPILGKDNNTDSIPTTNEQVGSSGSAVNNDWNTFRNKK